MKMNEKELQRLLKSFWFRCDIAELIDKKKKRIKAIQQTKTYRERIENNTGFGKGYKDYEIEIKSLEHEIDQLRKLLGDENA